MFLTNILVVMRTWSDNYQQINLNIQDEDWDNDNNNNNTIIVDNMKISTHYLFITIVDYLQSEHMTTDVEFDMWKRIITNKWTMNEKVLSKNKQRLYLFFLFSFIYIYIMNIYVYQHV